MGKVYFTIAGTNHHFGQDFFEPKMEVDLAKEPDNEYDKEEYYCCRSRSVYVCND